MLLLRHVRGVACAAACLALSSARAQDANQNARMARARELLALLTGGKLQEFVDSGTAEMKAVFTAPQAGQAWLSLTTQLGAFQGEQSAEFIAGEPDDTVRFTLRFERGTATCRLLLNKQGEMSGLWFDSIDADYAPPAYVRPASLVEEEVTVSAGQWPLPGTLTLPKSGGPHAGVVLVHGSGPHDRDESIGPNKTFRDLAWGLASQGVAVLRYEKRTKAHPFSQLPDSWTVESETVDDALAAARLLRGDNRINAKRVFIIGHSMGGWAAPLMAERDPELAGIVLLAANARNILELLEEQIPYGAKLDGGVSAIERQLIDDLNGSIAAIRAGKPAEAKPILGVGAAYWERLYRIDPVAVALRIKTPMLIVQGGRDYQVTTADFELWKKRLGEAGRPAEFKLYDDLNHLFINGSGKSTPMEYQQAGHVDERVIRDVAAWIGKH